MAPDPGLANVFFKGCVVNIAGLAATLPLSQLRNPVVVQSHYEQYINEGVCYKKKKTHFTYGMKFEFHIIFLCPELLFLISFSTI